MAKIIDGKAISAAKRAEIGERVIKLKRKSGITPGLAVIIVGDDPASKVYVRNKEKACADVGFYSVKYELPSDTDQNELNALIDRLNADPTIHGILCQLPLPKGLSDAEVIARISPDKDVDAFGAANVGRIMLGDYKFAPCTPAGIMELLKRSDIDPTGKHAVVVGRSNIVGKPMALLLLAANATVTVCHSKTHELAEITKQADILVAAVGKARFIGADMVKEGAVVIDVGMNRDEDGKLCGDVDFDEVSKVASAITPVPGGVGPMTITMLLENTLTAAEARADDCCFCSKSQKL